MKMLQLEFRLALEGYGWGIISICYSLLLAPPDTLMTHDEFTLFCH